MSDKSLMQKALSLAEKAKGKTSPNPLVGAVLVKGGRILAADYHKKAGTPHAEALVLNKAGVRAKGATLYVSLEPCCHTGKRTPPCTEAIIRSQVERVVIAMVDPNPSVSGMGVKALRNAGIKTKIGVLRKEAEALNEVFIKYITRKEPFTVLKIAQSIDGKIATARGESKWITGERARKHVHKLRSEVDALLVGIGTVKKDNPSLDCRTKVGRNPYRVIVDSLLQIGLNTKVLGYRDGRTIVATTPEAPERKRKLITELGHRVMVIKSRAGKVDLKQLVKELGKLEITSLMIEGGSVLAGASLEAGIVDKVLFFIAPKIIGGADAISSVGGRSPRLLMNAVKLKQLKVTNFGVDVLLESSLDYQ